jgi:hypothetical protein
MTQPPCGAKGENDRAGRDRYAALFEDRLHQRRPPRGMAPELAKLKALEPTTVIAGHQPSGEAAQARSGTAALDATAAYIRDFNAALATSKTAAELVQKMSAKYANPLPVILDIAAKASFAPLK